MKKNNFIIRLFFATIYRKLKIFYLRFKGFNFDYSVIIERGVKLDKLNPKGIKIGKKLSYSLGHINFIT